MGTNESRHARNPERLNRRDRELAFWFRAASAEQPEEQIFNTVLQRQGNRASGASEILAEATELDSKMNLKEHLIRAYQGMALATVLKAYPPTRPAGEALSLAMKAYSYKIYQEYLTLNALHTVVVGLIPTKILLTELMTAAKKYTTFVKNQTPVLAEAAARRIAGENGLVGAVFPRPNASGPALRLPIQIDPLAISRAPLTTNSGVVPEPGPRCACPRPGEAPTWDRVVKWTQLARASFPWVNYHREPILDVLDKTLSLADSRELYWDWTNGYTKRVCAELQEQAAGSSNPDDHLALYVMDDYEGPDKGYEKWNLPEYSDLATERFSVLGLAWAKPPKIMGPAIFPQEHPDGMMSWGMAMFYNANEQQRPNQRIDVYCKRTVPGRQANVGYDTLNFFSGSRQDSEGCQASILRPAYSGPGENRPFEVMGIGVPHEYPRIKVNWQVKLVPASAYRLRQLKQTGLPAPFGRLPGRLPDQVPDSMRTH